MKLFSVLLAATLFVSSVHAQCPGGVCPVPSAGPAVRYLHGWYEGGNGQLDFYWRGELAGTLNPLTADWKTNGKQRAVNLIEVFGLKAAGKPKDCICPGECQCKKCPDDCVARAADQSRHFGVDWSLMRKEGRETYRIGGTEVSEHDAYSALTGGGNVPDDAKTPRLVVLGSAQARHKVLDDWSTAPVLAAFRDKAIVQAYAPDHWHVAEAGYKQAGDPTIYLVDAKGKVVTWQKDYEGGPERLARTLTEGLRIADPTFDPSKSPDLSQKPATSPALPTPNQAGVGALAALAAGVGLLFYRKKRSS